MNINSPDNVVGRDYIEEAPTNEWQNRALLKATAKYQYHINRLQTVFRDRHSLRLTGHSPEVTAQFHIREIRTWLHIRESLLK